jgi:ribosomal protein S18 acetylase RimI-like enzyme
MPVLRRRHGIPMSEPAENGVPIEQTDTPDWSVWQTLARPLTAYNEAQAGPEDFRFLILLLRHPDTGEVIGGLWGRTLYGWLYIHLLVVPEELRRRGLGTRLMRLAENEALARGCRGALLDTFSFQARPFYERLGYQVYATIEDYPPGHRCYSMKKSLAAPPG